jgi:hypothetical protein
MRMALCPLSATLAAGGYPVVRHARSRTPLLVLAVTSSALGLLACIVVEQGPPAVRGPDAGSDPKDGGTDSAAAKDARSNAAPPPDAAKFSGHSYLVVCGTKVSWGDAKVAAEDIGGHLATLGSIAEHDFVVSLLNIEKRPECWKERPGGPWLGARASTLTDGGREWKWITAEPWVPAATRWDTGQPDNSGGDEDALQFLLTNSNEYRWNDSPGTPTRRSLGYVIEWEQ